MIQRSATVGAARGLQTSDWITGGSPGCPLPADQNSPNAQDNGPFRSRPFPSDGVSWVSTACFGQGGSGLQSEVATNYRLSTVLLLCWLPHCLLHSAFLVKPLEASRGIGDRLSELAVGGAEQLPRAPVPDRTLLAAYRRRCPLVRVRARLALKQAPADEDGPSLPESVRDYIVGAVSSAASNNLPATPLLGRRPVLEGNKHVVRRQSGIGMCRSCPVGFGLLAVTTQRRPA